MKTERLYTLLVQNKIFTIQDAAEILSIPHKQTSELLARLAKQGDLKRIKRGFYKPVTERFLGPDESFSNPWVVLSSLFPQSYIGGWSAASHYGLTDQLFEETCVLTLKNIRHTTQNLGRFSYHLFRIKPFQDFATKYIWFDQNKISISDPHKTIIDMISNPKCGAGIQHTVDCFKTYISELFDEKIFYSYAEKMQNGSFYKRLGFLCETFLTAGHPLCILAQKRMTKGYISIDSDLVCEQLITRWNLMIPKDMKL
ncbi:MAG: type IV toxin-antitoxin system AbiEi family antitoxin domain-containing protein [Candidatus Levybacteria bacterium]|jgi:predicted transcriptional regulator of viral defense system|nr:type IV toxin-antitoxin system AbiEi family antitoxin domain-containing protein [Candidatus Levybacteria bacterium]